MLHHYALCRKNKKSDEMIIFDVWLSERNTSTPLLILGSKAVWQRVQQRLAH
jgi:hypothetical protein